MADNPAAQAGTMPGRSHQSAPKFDGKPWSLKRFLNEVHELATSKGLSHKQAILATIGYAPSSDYELWRSLESAKGNSWDAFEKELCTLYPGSEGDRKYNRGQLDALTREAAMIPVTDHLQLGEYYRSFLTISTFLKSKERISDQECSSKFLEGLHYLFRAELTAYLRVREPTHHIDDPWPIATLYEAALFVLSNHIGGAAAPNPTMSTSTPASTARVKTEEYDATRIERFLGSDTFLNRIRDIIGPAIASQPSYNPRAYAPRQSPQVIPPYNVNMNAAPPVPPPVHQPAQGQWEDRPVSCIFCSDPSHFMSRCPHTADYLRRGLCIRDERNQIALPNGMYIGRRLAPGNNLKERIDAWHAMNPTGPGATVASANFVDVSSTRDMRAAEAKAWTDPWAVFTHEIAGSDTTDEGMSMRDREEIKILQNVAATLQQKITETRNRSSAQGPTTRSGKTYDAPPKMAPRGTAVKKDVPPHMSRQVSFAPLPEKPDPPAVAAAPVPASPKVDAPAQQRTSKNPFVSNSTPQFSYHTPIESTEAVTELLQQHLDSTITITNRQLLAVAPEVRRALKDQIITKRSSNAPVVNVNEVELAQGTDRSVLGARIGEEVDYSSEHRGGGTSSVEAFLSGLVARNDDVIVANHLEDLRCITVRGPGVGDIEAIMDDGSQIIAMRADVWEKTGLPLRTDHLMVMESANRTKSDTKGLLQDFPISIGDFIFYVQVQVVEHAAYEMLLGRPFLTLCQASTRHFSNGDSHLTLVDPNTQAVVTVPTHRRARAAATKSVKTASVNSFF